MRFTTESHETFYVDVVHRKARSSSAKEWKNYKSMSGPIVGEQASFVWAEEDANDLTKCVTLTSIVVETSGEES